MKKFIVVAAAVVMMMGLAGSAMAANSIAQGSTAISVGMGDSSFVRSLAPVQNADIPSLINNVVDISGRYFIAKDMGLFHANHASNYLPIKARLPKDKAVTLGLIDRALAGEVALKPEFMRAL